MQNLTEMTCFVEKRESQQHYTWRVFPGETELREHDVNHSDYWSQERTNIQRYSELDQLECVMQLLYIVYYLCASHP